MEHEETHPPSDFSEAAERVRDDLTTLRETIERQGSQIQRTVLDFVDERPLTAIGIAFGLGYVISGALVSRTTGRALAFGGRYALGRVVREAIAGASLGLFVGGQGNGRASSHAKSSAVKPDETL